MNQNERLESNPLITQLQELLYARQAISYLHWNVIRRLQTGLDFANLHP